VFHFSLYFGTILEVLSYIIGGLGMTVMEDDVNRYLDFLIDDKSFSANTVTAYKNDLYQLAEFLYGRAINSWDKVDQSLLIEHFLALRERSYASSTMARKIAAIKSFYNYQIYRGQMDFDPTEGLNRPQVQKSPPKAISTNDVQKLLGQVATTDTPDGKRDRAMLELLCATGLRVTELVSLNVIDVNLGVARLRCSGKGHKERYIDFSADVADVVEDYLASARTKLLRKAKETALFLNRRGERLTRQGFWLILKDRVKKANLSAEITPHTLRHSLAMNTLSSGKMNVKELQEFLGHANLSTTQVYEKAISSGR
jgi:integrase/recombinase XerD